MRNNRLERITAFLDDFNEAFATFSGDRVAVKFSFPCLAHSSDGTSRVFYNQAELARYFDEYLVDYRAKGCARCQYSELQVTELGETTALASVRWSLRDHAMAEVLTWRESYLLNIGVGSGAATAFATIDYV